MAESRIIIYNINKEKNIGQIVRSGAAFGVTQVILVGTKYKEAQKRTDQAATQPIYYRKKFVRVPWWRADAEMLTQQYADSKVACQSRILMCVYKHDASFFQLVSTWHLLCLGACLVCLQMTFIRYDTVDDCRAALKAEGFHIIGTFV